MTNTETTATKFDEIRGILESALGEITDGYTVMDVTTGYAEPGYNTDPDVVIVFGNWNNGSNPDLDENLPSELSDALEAAGAELEWYDEWHRCDECYRAVRTEPNSYGWTPSYMWVNDCEIVCASCAREDVAGYLEGYVNDSDKAVTWLRGSELEAAGFTQWAPGDPQGYEAGWHPGQNDNPAAILREILEDDEDAEVVFLIDGTGQFDVRFSAWVKDPEED